MTDTDLITAGGSTDNVALPDPVTSDDAQPEAVSAPRSRRARCGYAAPPSRTTLRPAAPGSLAAMVLPDLRALADKVGVKGASGMRKSELIAAIREQRGETNGAQAAPPPEAVGPGSAEPEPRRQDARQRCASPRPPTRGAGRGSRRGRCAKLPPRHS